MLESGLWILAAIGLVAIAAVAVILFISRREAKAQSALRSLQADVAQLRQFAPLRVEPAARRELLTTLGAPTARIEELLASPGEAFGWCTTRLEQLHVNELVEFAGSAHGRSKFYLSMEDQHHCFFWGAASCAGGGEAIRRDIHQDRDKATARTLRNAALNVVWGG